jgi:hypothetical protein
MARQSSRRRAVALLISACLCACGSPATAAAAGVSTNPAIVDQIAVQHAFGLNGDFKNRGLLGRGVELDEQQKAELSKLIADGGFYRVRIDAGGHTVMAAVRAVSSFGAPSIISAIVKS